jgi:hypothetical protein
MSNKTHRRRWLLEVAALGVALSIIMLTVRSDHGATPRVAQIAPAQPAISPRPATPAPAELVQERHRYIVQSSSADAARSAVQSAGGVVTCDLSVIRAVGAKLDDRELAALRVLQSPRLQIYDDTQVIASSTGILPETYYPSEVDASEMHLGGLTGRGVTVAVIDSGLWNNQGPLQYSPSGGGTRVLAQYDVILARQ